MLVASPAFASPLLPVGGGPQSPDFFDEAPGRERGRGKAPSRSHPAPSQLSRSSLGGELRKRCFDRSGARQIFTHPCLRITPRPARGYRRLRRGLKRHVSMTVEVFLNPWPPSTCVLSGANSQRRGRRIHNSASQRHLGDMYFDAWLQTPHILAPSSFCPSQTPCYHALGTPVPLSHSPSLRGLRLRLKHGILKLVPLL